MALQLGALRTALIDAGAKPELAEKAAEEVASFENRIGKIEADLVLLKWMVGTNVGLTVLVLGKQFGVIG